MKKLVIFLFILLVTSLVSAECFDSDGGENYIVKGTTTGIHDPTTGIVETVTDFCSEGSEGNEWVNEYVCGTEGPMKDLVVGTSAKCSYGCEDGACKINPETGKAFREIVKCVDSDEGVNFNITGHLTLVYDDGYTETLNEGCGRSSGSGEYGVMDYFCGFSQGKPHYWAALKPCKCENGICIETNETGEEETEITGTLFYFYSDTCPHCIGMPAELEKVSEILDYIEVKSIDEELDLFKKYEIRAVPTLVFVDENNCQIKREGGHIDYEHIIDWIQFSECSIVEEVEVVEEDDFEEPFEMPPEIMAEEKKITYFCYGCELDNKCYPMGYRKSGKYCSDNYEFIEQLKAGECDNNFECKSNICVSGECVGESLIKRIFAWFKKLFGGDEDEEIKLLRTKEVLENCPLFESVFEEFKLKPEEIEKGLKQGTLPWACKNDPSMSEALERGCEWDNECCSDLPKINNIESAQDFVKKFFYCYRMYYIDLGLDAPPGPVKSVNVTISDVRKLKYGYFMYIVPYDVIVKESTAEFITGSGSDLEEAWLYLSDSGCVLPCPTEEEIPYEPDYWVYCTEEDEELGKECQERGGVPQGGPHPDKDKNCDVYIRCIFGERRD